MNVPEKISALRKRMVQNKINFYIVPTADFHQSEYVGDYFKVRQWLTGFKGSTGTAVITLNKAGLWTDGRYFLAAEEQLEGSGIDLFKMGEPNVPTIPEFLSQEMKPGEVIGFDGRTISMQDGLTYETIAKTKGGTVSFKEDLINQIWTDRPHLSKEPAFLLEPTYSGEDTASKLNRLREEMVRQNVNTHIITTLDDLCWLLNIRGDDIAFFPMVLSYGVITLEDVFLFIDDTKLDSLIKEELVKNHVTFKPYNDIYKFVTTFNESTHLLIDKSKVNYALVKNIPNNTTLIEAINPTILFKVIKNQTEINNMKQAQLKDGIVHTKYMYWLKHEVGKIPITELSATEKLETLRREQDNYIRQSFSPITAYGEHGAIIHYEANEETNSELKEGSFLLSDTGAGFYEGSTDITRTFALGKVSDELKNHYTLTLQSNIQLDRAKFLRGVNGANLDVLARQPFWQKGLNYNHGTGHGVGYLLNIHEGPIGFRWQYHTEDTIPLEEGMVITNEPGIYIAGSHGVRLENELLVVKDLTNEYGDFLSFETITYVPFDLDAINQDMLQSEEKEWLNAYHAKVYNLVSPHLTENERNWMKEITRPI